MSARVEMREIEKHFGGVRAVAGVDLDLHPGEVVGVLGHNGAGKSTLMRVLSGAQPCDTGSIRIDGKHVNIDSPRRARELGIETLYQELALVDELDAVGNLFLGRELRSRFGLLDEDAMEASARDVLARLNPNFTQLREPVRRLSGGQRQAIAIARAVHFEARVLILDEPTAALGPAEKQVVTGVIEALRDEGMGILLVSHDLHDVMDVSTRIVVMRNGHIVGEGATRDLEHDEVVAWIVGGEARHAKG
ncbi:MAG: ATP-binding cassette domain-containing protein [Myxococcota bacterium]|nr:ATP-binding cassette domain-containing protein [Myxococcota bacterium]